jgi:hypothetical protein
VPCPLERVQQLLFATVPDANPDESSGHAGPERQVKKVLIFAHENVFFRNSVSEDINVGCICHTDLKNVPRVAASGFDPTGESRRQLVIDQKLHDALRMEWSDWWAVYSIAA